MRQLCLLEVVLVPSALRRHGSMNEDGTHLYKCIHNYTFSLPNHGAVATHNDRPGCIFSSYCQHASIMSYLHASETYLHHRCMNSATGAQTLVSPRRARSPTRCLKREQRYYIRISERHYPTATCMELVHLSSSRQVHCLVQPPIPHHQPCVAR